jgi:hypothetical protein
MPVSSDNCFLLLNGTGDKDFHVSILYNFYLHCLSPNGPCSKNNNVQLREVIPSELKTARTKENKKNKPKDTQESLDVSIWNANGCEFTIGTLKYTELQLHQLLGTVYRVKIAQREGHCVHFSMPYQQLSNWVKFSLCLTN